MNKKLHLLASFLIVFTFSSKSQCTTSTKPSSLLLNSIDTSISIYFTASSPTPTGYLCVLSTSATLSSSPVSGTVYSVGDALGGGKVVYNGPTYVFRATGLLPNTKYYINVFSWNSGTGSSAPCYSSSVLTGNITTATLAARGIPAGYYSSITTQTCGALKTALNAIIKPTVANPTPTYQGIRGSIELTDARYSDDGSKLIVWDDYTDNPMGAEAEFTFGDPYQDNGTGGSVEGDKYNREHTFPQAWFGPKVEPMYSDLFIVYPADKYVNGIRASFPYGKVGTATKTFNNGAKFGSNSAPASSSYSGNVFEPSDAYKGDLARANLYVITAYQDSMASWSSQYNTINSPVLDGSTYPSLTNWYLNLLYQWHLADPVSQREIDRNNNIYMIQGNRNPFVDNPSYVARLFSCVTPVNLINFNAVKNSDGVNIDWNVNNEDAFKNYDLERSVDGINFTKISSIAAQNFTNYSYADNLLPASNIVYYRIKMVDINGAFTYSKIATVKINSQLYSIVIYPNPTTDLLTIKLPQNIKPNSILKITDAVGRTVLQKNIPFSQNNVLLNVQFLAAGKYFVYLKMNSEIVHQSFVKTN